jgi:hypothetical protein
MSKSKDIKMHQLVVLSMLMQECLDDLNPTTEKMKTLRSTLLEFTEELNRELQDTETIRKTTYFQDLCNRVETVIRKNFNPDM